jgi:ribosome modulation factor
MNAGPLLEKEVSLEESYKIYSEYVSRRAFQEGYAAFIAKIAKSEIPSRVGIYAGKWVEGWLAASLDASSQPGAAKTVDESPRTSGIAWMPSVNAAAMELQAHQLN